MKGIIRFLKPLNRSFKKDEQAEYGILDLFDSQSGVIRDLGLYIRHGKVSHKWFPFLKFDTRGTSIYGYKVPKDIEVELGKNINTQTVMATLVSHKDTSTDRVSIISAKNANVRWPGEYPPVQDTHVGSIIDIPVHVMLVTLTIGDSALEDVTFTPSDEWNEAVAEAVAVAYDQLIAYGDGQGKIEGLFPKITDAIGNPPKDFGDEKWLKATNIPEDFVTKTDGTLLYDHLMALYNALPSKYRSNACWVMNSNTALTVATLKKSDDEYLINQRDESLSSVGVPDKLLEFPIVYNEYMDDLDVSGGVPIFFGDFKEAFTLAHRDGISIRRFVDAEYATKGQMLILSRVRLGGQPTNYDAYRVLRTNVTPTEPSELSTKEVLLSIKIESGMSREQIMEQLKKLEVMLMENVEDKITEEGSDNVVSQINQ